MIGSLAISVDVCLVLDQADHLIEMVLLSTHSICFG